MANNPFDSQKYQNFLNWFKDCKSNPYNQNTYLFGEGLSYYEQLSSIGSFLYDLKEYITTSDWTTGDELQAIIDQIEAEKQNVLISGENIKTINSASILSSGNLDLQEKLIPGENIVISPDGRTISASGTVGVDYPNVSNKPQINGHTLQSGNNTLDTLGIQAKDNTILFQSDVIDNLASESTNLPLSANQGKVLDEKKQDVLVSGSDIKTLAEIPLLGKGNIPLKTLNGQSLIGSENIPIKTVGSESIFGSGNIAFKTLNSNSLMGEGNITLMDLVENAINNNILLTDANGQAIDSGKQLSQLQELLTAGTGINIIGNVISSFSRIELIWSNSTPTTPFNTQVVRTGITNAKAFYIAFREKSSSTRCKGVIVMSNNLESFVEGLTFSASPYIAYARPFTPNFEAGTISFEAAYPMNAYGTWGSADNNYAIPYRIYALY